MEKFGIFNILSALSDSLAKSEDSDKKDGAAGREKEEPERPATAGPRAGIFTPEERANRMIGILERHERISKNIDRKK